MLIKKMKVGLFSVFLLASGVASAWWLVEGMISGEEALDIYNRASGRNAQSLPSSISHIQCTIDESKTRRGLAGWWYATQICCTDVGCIQESDRQVYPTIRAQTTMGNKLRARIESVGRTDANSSTKFSWSQAGKISGMYCTRVYEDADPAPWGDNYLCSSNDIGMQWSQAGAISGMKCTRVHEDADPHAWSDNYLCVPPSSPINFRWSQAGAISGMNCTRVYEDADPHAWNDNYLCW